MRRIWEPCGYYLLLGKLRFTQCCHEYLHEEKKLLEEGLKETPLRMPCLGLSTRKALLHCSLLSGVYGTLASERTPTKEVPALSSSPSHSLLHPHILRYGAILVWGHTAMKQLNYYHRGNNHNHPPKRWCFDQNNFTRQTTKSLWEHEERLRDLQ